MTQKLSDFLKDASSKRCATQTGTDMHAKMQHIVIDDKAGDFGDKQIVSAIKSCPALLPFFVKQAQTEVPIAGCVNGKFLSRRIDRLLINKDTKTIDFIDYKTDINKSALIDKYKFQLKEYALLLQSAYGEYKITGYILWLHDWSLERIIRL